MGRFLPTFPIFKLIFMKKILFSICFIFFFGKGFSQMRIIYCDACYTSIEGGAAVILGSEKVNPGVYLQLNSNVALSTNLLELKGGIQYAHFFSKIDSKNEYDAEQFSINKFGIPINLDFLLNGGKYVLSPGVDFSIYSSKIIEPDNFRIGASLEAGYYFSDNLQMRAKFTKNFKSIFIKENEIDVSIANLGLVYVFR